MKQLAANTPEIAELRQLLLHTPQDALAKGDRDVVSILLDSGADYDFTIRALLSYFAQDAPKRALAYEVGLCADPAWRGWQLDEERGLIVCPQGHSLHGSIKAGAITTSACAACERDRDRAYTEVTGRTKNMAPVGFKYVCSHGLECHIDRTGVMSTGYPYHVGGKACSDPASVQRVPE